MKMSSFPSLVAYGYRAHEQSGMSEELATNGLETYGGVADQVTLAEKRRRGARKISLPRGKNRPWVRS